VCDPAGAAARAGNDSRKGEDVLIKARSSVLILGLLLAAACSLGGCAYTTVTSEIEKPELGPKVATGVSAVVPLVKDQRAWQQTHSDQQADPNIRIFAPEITDIMISELSGQGLFARLEKHDGPVPETGLNVLEIDVSAFKWAKTGKNEWVVAQLLADGVLLPAYTVVALASGGDIDMGGYVFPSTKIGTNFNFTSSYKENDVTVLARSYAVTLPLGSVSERRLRDSLTDDSKTGVKLGKEQGLLALKLACETMARDPRWSFLPQYRILALAEKNATDAGGAEIIKAAQSAMPLLKDMPYSSEVAKILRDGTLTASMRADIANDLRARQLGIKDPTLLPKKDIIDEAAAEKLFNDPAVEFSIVKNELATRSLALAAKAIAPQAAKKKAAAGTGGQESAGDVAGANEAGPSPQITNQVNMLEDRRLEKEAAKPALRAADKVVAPESPEVKAMRQAFIAELAANLKNKPKVQALLLKQADKAVGPDWENMLQLLKAVDSPSTRAYIAKREG
jgi:hypothetical protein